MSTIDLRSLMHETSVDAALERGVGFVRVAAEEAPHQPRPTLTYPSMQLQEWVEICNNRGLPIPAPGCLFDKGLIIYGPGHVMQGDELLTEPTQMAEVAGQWHANDVATLRSRKARVIKTPIIAALTPGHKIYGHWLADILPRLAVAQLALGEKMDEWAIALPSNTPQFALNMCEIFLDRKPNFEFYDYDNELIISDKICVPTSPVSMEHNFHSIVRDFYAPHQAKSLGSRKICLSRSRVEGKTDGAVKSFPQREALERIAVAHGYDIIYPEEFSLSEQIKIFQESCCVVGEFGSGLHNSIFAGEGAIIGATGYFNTYQQRLCEMSGQINTFAIPYEDAVVDGIRKYACREEEISDMFEAIDRAL